ncbi:MAG: cytochrome bc complex cytochrome b subunit [Anaerolineales bacterium]|nr:cytochrome bc complex cytochrome b subunit [Anaerolineales bacterium]
MLKLPNFKNWITQLVGKLKSVDIKDLSTQFKAAADNRVRIITAGLSVAELRALMRGDPPTERPNPRYKVHVTSFLFHIRPKFYQQASTIFTHTWRLGFFTVFFFGVEVITGLILMMYYTPSPEHAYQSILNLTSNVPYGKLLRDMHRLGAEGMVIFTTLHMLRTFLTGSYKKERSFTWLTGLALLGITLFLSFSGYLLPWDQLAYWAVTIGTSMAESAPLFGNEANLLLRGAPDIGAGGLLRFYLMHVVLLPLIGILLISVHYYKVSREHGISLPARYEEEALPPEKLKEGKRRIDFLPDLLTHEMFLTSVGIFALVIIAGFFYSAPLENIANPQVTPLDTKAPWYFWWLQGMLKLGDKTLMGIILPTILVGLLIAIPYIDRNPHRQAHKRPVAMTLGMLAIVILIVLSYMGLPEYGIETPAATRIVQDLAPEEGLGDLRAIPYDELQPGVYEVNVTPTEDLCPTIDFGCPALEAVFAEYTDRVNLAEEEGLLPDAQAVLVIEDWQAGLRKVTPRIVWTDPVSGNQQSYEKHIFLHSERNRDH